MSSDRTLEVNLGVDEHDELDRKIDRVLGRMGTLIRTLFVLAILAFAGIFIVLPQWDIMGPFITTGLYLVFQLFYVAFLMIFQFIVLFWFIGRPRIYWLMPGETGVGFKDYKGNPEVLESARQVVTLLKGVKRFKLMGGTPIRGLLLEGPPGTGKSYLGQAIATEKVKHDLGYQERVGIVDGPADDLAPEVRARIQRTTKRIYRTLGLDGYARIDFRLSADGTLYFIEANPNPEIAKSQEFATAAQHDGLDYPSLLHRILALGISRANAGASVG